MLKQFKNLVSPLALCVLSGIVLGFSQHFYFDGLTVAAFSDQQSILGLLALVGYVPFFWLIARSNLKNTFWFSFLIFTVHYTIVLYWIYIALHVHGHIAPPAAAAITLVLPLILALLNTSFIVLGRFVSLRFNRSFLWLAPCALVGGEYLKNYYLFGGFPWGHAGYALGRIDEFLQLASVFGVYGLVFFAGIINALFTVCIMGGRARIASLLASLSIIGLMYGFGAVRLKGAEHEFAPMVRVAALQGNIAQEMKSQGKIFAQDILAIYEDLQRQAKEQGAELIIWPESAYPRLVDENISKLRIAHTDGVATVVGASAYGEDQQDDFYVRNSAFFMNYEQKIVKRYDKVHLVPFGEYVPWPFSGIVDKVVPGMGAYRRGTDFYPENLQLSLEKNISLGATVCYEGLFPEIARSYAKNGAALLINHTNDAWYGRSSAPYQHLSMYRMRSAETGLAFVRATNSGVSAFVDAYGRIQRSLGLFERGVLIDNIALVKKDTIYVSIGDVIPIACVLLLIFCYLAAVLPIHEFIKKREYKKILLLALLAMVAVGGSTYYHSSRFILDESAGTKALFIVLFCLILMVGFLSRSKRSRSILLSVSVATIIVSLVLAIFESLYFLLGLLLGLLIYLLAFRMKETINISNRP